jgi:hypothetical protein
VHFLFHDPRRQPLQNPRNPVETTVQHEPGLLPQQRPTLPHPGTQCAVNEWGAEGVLANEPPNDSSRLQWY